MPSTKHLIVSLMLALLYQSQPVLADGPTAKCDGLQKHRQQIGKQLEDLQNKIAKEQQLATHSLVDKVKLNSQLHSIEVDLQQTDDALQKNSCAAVVGTKDWCYFFLQDMEGCGNESHYKEHCASFQDKVLTGGKAIDLEDDAIAQNGCTCGKSPAEIMKEAEEQDGEGRKSKVFDEKRGSDGKLVSISFRTPPGPSGSLYYSFFHGESQCKTSYGQVADRLKAALAKGHAQQKQADKSKYGNYE